jgi:short-subunit dehydrogenase
MIGTPIKVTTVYPGYIASEMNEKVTQPTPLLVSTKKGVASMVRWIEREPAEAMIPAWPWLPLSYLIKYAPLSSVRRFS